MRLAFIVSGVVLATTLVLVVAAYLLLVALFALIVAVGMFRPLAPAGEMPSAPSAPAYQYHDGGQPAGSYGGQGGY